MASGSNGRRISSYPNGDGKTRFKMEVDESRLIATSRQLTKNELAAFYDAFTLFDHKGNGRISCEEFLETLRRVGVSVNESVVYDLIVAQDENGNGELDFEEYLNFMTNEDIFMGVIGGLHAPNKPDYKDVLLYEVMSHFISKSCLKENQRKEIVGYYTRKLKTAAAKKHNPHAAHVVHHYANGARSLGLTEKEIFNQIESIKKMAENEGDEKKKNSPYANPIQLILTPTGTQKTNEGKQKQPGWCSPQIADYGVKLPRINIKEPKTCDCVHDIRKQIQDVKEEYYWNLSKAQQKNFVEVWKNLHVGNISSDKLKTMMKEIYGTYTASRLTGCRGEKGKKNKIFPPFQVPNSSANNGD